MPDAALHRNRGPALFKALSAAFTVFIVIYILIPILVTLVMSFNEAAMIRFPITGWSLKWYRDFLASPQWTEARVNSVVIALGTAAIATPSGILAAWAFERFEFPLKSALYLLIVLPLLLSWTEKDA